MTTARVLLHLENAADNLDPRNEVVAVELPEGYYRVWFGALKPGDRYLNCQRIRQGVVSWEPVTEFPTPRQARDNEPYSSAKWYGCLIRRGQETVPPCERCQLAGRYGRNRFCEGCSLIVLGK